MAKFAWELLSNRILSLYILFYFIFVYYIKVAVFSYLKAQSPIGVHAELGPALSQSSRLSQ